MSIISILIEKTPIKLQTIAWTIPKSYANFKKTLDKEKDELANIFNDKKKTNIFRQLDLFKNEKSIIAKMGNTYNVSNAWLKCYELLSYYNIIPNEVKESYVHFGNAEFPGSFICASHHYIATKTNWLNKYIWKGSSLVEINELNEQPLADEYALWKNYTDNWLMNKIHSGDVLNKDNQHYFEKYFKHTVDLYTADLGFDVSKDPNAQEKLQLQPNIGQVLSGLLTLKNGGNQITKQYMFFEPRTISLFALLSNLFKKLYICKPVSSKKANSEIYLVGLNYTYNEPIVYHILNNLDNELPFCKVGKKFLQQIEKISKVIFNEQIEKIKQDIKLVNDEVNLSTGINTYKPIMENQLIDWYSKYPILPIEHIKRLNMKDKFKQMYNKLIS